jgi:outer membrane protein assembly factor BamB
VELVTGSADGNWLYAVMPVWDDPTLYWCLLSGIYNPSARTLYSDATIAVVQIVPDAGQSNGCTTTLVDAMRLSGQWNNNSFAVAEEGAYFVTNGVDDQGISRLGKLISVALDPGRGKITLRWAYDYKNSGIPKVGKTNIGSGTTATLMNLDDGTRLVAIMDNALPQENVVVVDRKNGRLVTEVPLFPRMRGGNEASLIGVKNWVGAENNFGHSNPVFGMPQLVANEPGVALIQLEGSALKPNVVWEDTRTCCLGMNMLCRESGIIFAHTADWYDSESATEGAIYGIAAIDAWDGRVIWRIPLGRGQLYTKDYGGQYFDRDGNLYIGAYGHLISIQNA